MERLPLIFATIEADVEWGGRSYATACVFDGHGGSFDSRFVAEQLPTVLTKVEAWPSDPAAALSAAYLLYLWPWPPLGQLGRAKMELASSALWATRGARPTLG